MTRPSLAIRFIADYTAQVAARISLEGVHDFFGSSFRVYDRMNVIRSYMRRQETPATV